MATDTVVTNPAASGLGKLTPEIFDGSEGKWLEWRFVFEAYQSRQGGADAITLLAHAAAHPNPLHLATLGDQARTYGYKLFGDLALLSRGTALRVVKSAETGNGLGAWQALVQRYQGDGAMRQKGVLQHILYFNWKGPAMEWQDRYMQWKELMSQYDHLVDPSDQLAAAVRVAIVIEGSRHASQQLRDQLFVNVEQFDTFPKLDEYIRMYFHQLAAYTPAVTPMSRSTGDMEVDAPGKDKKGDFHGFCGGCGKWGHKYRFCPHQKGGKTSPHLPAEKVEAGIVYGKETFILGVLQDDRMCATTSTSSTRPSRVLIDSGSAVTAFPWSFGEGYDTEHRDSLNLVSVTGDKIRNWGHRVVPCKNSQGQQVELRGESSRRQN